MFWPQLEPSLSPISLTSDLKVDFRMNPEKGEDFITWIKRQSESDLEEIFYKFGEEPKSKKLAKAMKSWSTSSYSSSKVLADNIARALGYRDSKRHPATRIFQALRMAINSEVEELIKMLKWTFDSLNSGGRLVVISFHSGEDRIVKKSFKGLERDSKVRILTKRAIIPSESEQQLNTRSRSAKLRVYERV